MRIWIDPVKLGNLGLSTQDVIAAVQSQNVQAAAGRIGAAPLSADQRLQLTVTTKGRLSTKEEFENIIVRAQSDSSFVRVKDIARVELSGASFDTEARYEGKPAAPVGVYLSPGANAVNVANAVSKRLDDLRPRFPEGVAFAYVYNTAEFVSAMMVKVVETLLEAFALVAIVVFVFLGRLRPTLIPLIAVPVSIIGTIAVLLAFGYSANTISLLALVLAIGIVVDDAIIVVENVERVMHEEPNLTPAEATRKAMSEIAGPVIAITLVLLSVFIPVAFLPGSSGVLFRQFAVTISAAMVISAINALTLSPALCSLLLKPGHPIGIMARITNGIDGVGERYAGVIRRLVKLSTASLAALVAVATAAYLVFLRTPSGFLPDEDKGFLITVVSLPPGASLNRTSIAAAKAEAILHKEPAVDGVTAVLGFDFLSGGAASNSGVIFVRLKGYDKRTNRRHARHRRRAPAVRRAVHHPRRHRDRAQSAGDFRPRAGRRLRVHARSPAGPGSSGHGRCDARPRRRRQPASRADPRLLDVRGRDAADPPRYRSRQDARPRHRHRRRLRGAAGDARRLLHQRLQPVRSRLDRAHAGRGSSIAPRSTTSRRSTSRTPTAR